ncbi:MAG: patatin-like phospholipase family protein, partial [Actinomycetota bacterium]|nr:patatin-like phospholipase family protein [Actinomycetota bacterium]
TAVVQHGPPLTTSSEGSAICLSGGGIRAAAFAWGALAELERHRPIEQFDRLYSVSGGGYAAAAYTGADASLRDDPRFFSDAQLARDDGETVDNARYDFVRRHRAYLANGRGGLVRAVMLALGSVLLNLVVIFLGVVVIAVPVGVLARNELGDSGEAFVAAVGWPVVVTAVLAVVALLLSAAVDHEPPRRALTASGVFLAAALALGVIRVGLPWLAVNSDSLMSGAWWRNVLPAAVLWIGSLLFAILRPRLSKVAIRLGGLISAAAIVFASIFVTRITIDDTRHWALDRSFLDDARWLLPICVVLLVLVDYSGVQWWSLHPLYRDRLAGTFLMKPKGDGLAAQHCDDWATWCDLQDRPKPVHVVCAATHRRESDVTGLRSTS